MNFYGITRSRSFPGFRKAFTSSAAGTEQKNRKPGCAHKSKYHSGLTSLKMMRYRTVKGDTFAEFLPV
jgi:hypothetical protein